MLTLLGAGQPQNGSYVNELIKQFKLRVASDGGTFEAESCLNTTLTDLNNDGLLEQASLVITPNSVKTSKLYAIKSIDGTGDLSVVRATTATRVNENGLIEAVPANVARLDYTNGSCPSILVEPQRTNLFLKSNSFNDFNWSKLSTVVTENTTISPFGTLTADTLAGQGATSLTFILQTTTGTLGSPYAISIFAKKEQTKFLQIGGSRDGFGDFVFANFDLENGIIGTTGTSNISTKIEDYGNGWFRCSIVATSISTTVGAFLVPVNSLTATRNPVFNNTNHSIYIWGAQFEAGANATSYIPTDVSAVTRNQDVISKTGISDLIGQTEGTVFVEFFYKNNFTELLNIQNTTSSFLMRTRIGQVGTNILSTIYANGGSFPLHPNYTLTPNSINKICIVYNYANKTTKLFANGVFVGSTVGTNAYPTTSQNRIGLGNFAGDSTESRFNIVNVFKTQLTDAECIALTTL